MPDQVMLELLRTIDRKLDSGFEDIGKRLDFHDGQISSLNETRAEQRGGFKLLIGLSTVISAIVGYVAALMGKS